MFGYASERSFYRNKETEQTRLDLPKGLNASDTVEERIERDTERFAMEWHRAGGKAAPKESWGSWIKRGTTKAVTAVTSAEPSKPAEGVPPAGAAAEKDPAASFNASVTALETKLRGDAAAKASLAQLSSAWAAREATWQAQVLKYETELKQANEKSKADDTRLDRLLASAAADKKRLGELESGLSRKGQGESY